MNEFWIGLKTGGTEAFRGYFAPLRLAPWRAALDAGRAPGARWFSPAIAWFAEIERIVVGDASR